MSYDTYEYGHVCGTCNQPYGAHSGVKCPIDGRWHYSDKLKFKVTGKIITNTSYDEARNGTPKRKLLLLLERQP